MEVSALKSPMVMGRHGRSPLLRLQSDDHLIALIRGGHDSAFETLLGRYESRLLAFCRHLLGSREDAEDVLQEVFSAAYNAIVADERPINVRPWLYRIARNRCLNHLRRTPAIGVDSMDVLFFAHGESTADRFHRREEFRMLVGDIGRLPETQKTALILREMDALSYEQIAEAMETTVSSVKSLLVRARMSLAEAAEARLLSCADVRGELGELAEGLINRVSPQARRHLRSCELCSSFDKHLKRNNKAFAALFPVGPFALWKAGVLSRLTGSGGHGAAATGSAASCGGASAPGFISAGLGAVGTKAAAGLAVAVVATAVGVTAGTQGHSSHHAHAAAASGAAATGSARHTSGHAASRSAESGSPTTHAKLSRAAGTAQLSGAGSRSTAITPAASSAAGATTGSGSAGIGAGSVAASAGGAVAGATSSTTPSSTEKTAVHLSSAAASGAVSQSGAGTSTNPLGSGASTLASSLSSAASSAGSTLSAAGTSGSASGVGTGAGTDNGGLNSAAGTLTSAVSAAASTVASAATSAAQASSAAAGTVTTPSAASL